MHDAPHERIAHERANEILASSPDCIKVLDLVGRLQFMNSLGQELLGIADVDEFIGSYWVDFWKGLDRTRAQNAIESAKRGEQGRFIGFFRTLRGEPKWWDVLVAPIVAADGSVTGILAASRDVTETRRSVNYFELLANVGAIVDSETDRDEMLARFADLVTLGLADICTVDLFTGGVLLRAAWSTNLVEGAEVTASLADPPSPGLRRAIDRAIATRTATLDRQAADPSAPQSSYSERVTASIIVPLLDAQKEPFGVLSLYLVKGGRQYGYDDVDVTLAKELARRIEVALRNMRSYQRELTIATALQRASLPAALPEHDAIQVDAVYAAAGDRMLAGGDWYDVSHVRNRILLSIGDVGGHGLKAAVVMARLRQSIRTATLMFDAPDAILEAAHHSLLLEESGSFATCVLAMLDPATGRCTIASAGHPAPFLCRGGDVSQVAVQPSIPLGAELGISRSGTGTDVELQAGDLLVFFTDGLIERSKDIDAGLNDVAMALRQVAVSEAHAPARALFEHLAVVNAPDDVAILAVRYKGHD